jgi:outer membrane lipoprotein LolB
MHRFREPARRWLVRAAAALSTLGILGTLSACATPALERVSEASAAEVPLPSFEITGRLSARHGDDSLAANFHWRRAASRDELDLASPLGQTIARLSGDSGNVRLETSDGRVMTASDWAELTARGLGWPLPVEGLAFWIQGTPRPGSRSAAETDGNGRLSVLRQDGWTIVYQSFAQAAGGDWRPSRMTLSYPDVEVRLAIDTWR